MIFNILIYFVSYFFFWKSRRKQIVKWCTARKQNDFGREWNDDQDNLTVWIRSPIHYGILNAAATGDDSKKVNLTVTAAETIVSRAILYGRYACVTWPVGRRRFRSSSLVEGGLIFFQYFECSGPNTADHGPYRLKRQIERRMEN